MKDGKFIVTKDIPLDKECKHVIKKGTDITLTHDVFFMDGGMLSEDYQMDFRKLVLAEMRNGWKYLTPCNPVIGKSII